MTETAHTWERLVSLLTYELWIFTKIRVFNSFLGFALLLRALAFWGLEENDYATWLPCTGLSHVSAQQINLESRGTLLQMVTLGFILEAGDLCTLSFPKEM